MSKNNTVIVAVAPVTDFMATLAELFEALSLPTFSGLFAASHRGMVIDHPNDQLDLEWELSFLTELLQDVVGKTPATTNKGR